MTMNVDRRMAAAMKKWEAGKISVRKQQIRQEMKEESDTKRTKEKSLSPSSDDAVSGWWDRKVLCFAKVLICVCESEACLYIYTSKQNYLEKCFVSQLASENQFIPV